MTLLIIDFPLVKSSAKCFILPSQDEPIKRHNALNHYIYMKYLHMIRTLGLLGKLDQAAAIEKCR